MTYKQLSLVSEESIGTYGTAWLNWMESNHKKIFRELKSKSILFAVARSIDKSAWEYREILDRDYAKMYPRPVKYEDIVKWERTREYYSDSTVMRERVLYPYTAP
jgi:hypothetical protein